MRFVHTLDIPPATPKSSPATKDVKLLDGTITVIEVSFPPGPASLVSVAIRDRLYQIAPANRENFFAYDNITLKFTVNYKLINPPFDVTLFGFAPTTIFPHKITFRFDVTPRGGMDDRTILEQLIDSEALPGRMP